MSLNGIKSLFKKTSFRLTVRYSVVYIISALALFMLTYFLLSQSIRDNNRRLARTKLSHYEKVQKTMGLNALIAALNREQPANMRDGFYVRLTDGRRRTLFQTIPFGLKDIDPHQIEQAQLKGGQKWFVLSLDSSRGSFEFRSLHLTEDATLQVGFGMEERRRLLLHFQRIFTLFSAPILLLSILGGFFAAHRALRPVRDLIRTLPNIDSGRLDARAPSRGSNDELDELVDHFNLMLARIETLVNGMRQALTNVAHDLRTPVTRLRMSVETRLAGEQTVAGLREGLMDCAEESERIITILNTLLDLSEAETGAMRLDRQNVDAVLLIREVLELYQYVAEDKQLEIITQTPDSLHFQADPNRVRQALANILDNAIKYTGESGEILVSAKTEGDQVVISISDNGPGISPEDLPHIFDRLYRGDKSRSKKGLGLGLSLVQAVTHAHGGRVEVDDASGRGATFTLRFPIGPPHIPGKFSC